MDQIEVGNIAVTKITEAHLTKVKAKLQTICKKLSESWLERLRTPDLLDAAVKAFGNLEESGRT